MNNLLTVTLLDFTIQLVGFAVAFALQTEKFYDLTGSCTFILVAQASLRWRANRQFRRVLLSTMVTVWAARLGLFLFYRVLHEGGDKRFNKVKSKPVTFLIYWMIQGVWIIVMSAPVLFVNNERQNVPINTRDYVGFAVWLFGMFFEIMADLQKLTFRNNPDNAGKFISSGLWSISRHPNYFGEIVLWVGVFIIASSDLTGWTWVSILSPVFLYYLLNNVSGVPILERSGLKRYGELPEYKQYINTVPVLVPFVGRT
uniref:Uncharacterized LOC100182009 n=1 Tax=Ciona intestinalis TaxID=7719 RepID=A0A1W5BHL0_CIOIN|nr:uncharacterized protein LOC100182009 [Ciona intestinalis]|eukprot:XP_002124274.1 uncharacterized protein LOC100182009 [Ciona intestinalis]